MREKIIVYEQDNVGNIRYEYTKQDYDYASFIFCVIEDNFIKIQKTRYGVMRTRELLNACVEKYEYLRNMHDLVFGYPISMTLKEFLYDEFDELSFVHDFRKYVERESFIFRH